MTNPYQGYASLTATEIIKAKANIPAEIKKAITNNATSALKVKISPYETIYTSGAAVAGKDVKQNTDDVNKQAKAVWDMALANVVVGQGTALGATSAILEWAKKNKATSDPIANVALIPMIQAYDLMPTRYFESDERPIIGAWLTSIATAIQTGQEAYIKAGKQSGINNHQSWALYVIGLIGAVTGNRQLLNYADVNMNLQIGRLSPPPGIDYAERKAWHYVAYNLQALLNLDILLARALIYNGGSILSSDIANLQPYATGAKTSINEFVGSDDPDDAKRIKDGTLSKVFNTMDCLPVFELWGYVEDTSGVIDGILKQHGETVLSSQWPSVNYWLNRSVKSAN